MNKKKQIFDYVHGLMPIDSFYFKFIDTPHFQRLRELYQLTTSQFVFPCANHRRFEHSLGTFFLAQKYMKAIQENQKISIETNLFNTISLTALCHNIGYSPYSESFEMFCKEKNIPFNHNEMAVKVLDNLLDTFSIDPNADETQSFDVDLLHRLLLKKERSSHYYEGFICNTKNGIDADIFDSLKRDIYKYGFPQQSFEYQILMNNAFVVDDEICFREQDAYSIYDLYKMNFIMSKKFYLHRVAKSIDLMIKDIFLESDEYFKYNSILDDVSEFIDFNDNIIELIAKNKSPKLEKAKKIIDRIYHRDFYAFAGEYDSSNLKESFDVFNEETLLNYTSSDETKLSREDIKVFKIKLNLGIDENDPIDYVSFYNNEFKKVKVKRQDISQLLPNKFQESIIRIYVTRKDQDLINAAQQALINYCSEKGTGAPLLYKSDKKVNAISDFKIDSSIHLKNLSDIFN